MTDFLNALKSFIEAVAPSLAILIWDYELSKEEAIKNEVSKVKLALELEQNHELVDKENSGKSDSDIIDSIIDGNGAPTDGTKK